jgi:signal transduction histidine kinase
MTTESPDAPSPPDTEPKLRSAWSVVTQVMRRQPWWVALAPSVVLTLLMGWLDDVTGWEVSLFIFYAVPIVIAVWWIGISAGLFITALAGAAWWFANLDTHPYITLLGYSWALVNREFYFCVVVFAVMAVRNKQEADDARIRMLEEQRQLEEDIVSVSEHEQQRIGRDLHDGLCQHLAAIGCAARVLADDLRAQAVPAARDAVMIEESIQQAVLEARNLAHGIFPVHVDRNGLSAALSDLARVTSRLTGVSIRFEEASEVHLDNPEFSMHLYRIAQEAVANAVRHGQAKEIIITLHLTPGSLVLQIDDDGKGIPDTPKKNTGGMGLRTMRYRAQILGSRLQIQPRAGGGTSVTCRLPIASQTHETNPEP